jgi:hypothetical protein
MTTTTGDDTIRDATGKPATAARPRLGRRITWEQFYQMRPDLRPANDNRSEEPYSDRSNLQDGAGDNEPKANTRAS